MAVIIQGKNYFPKSLLKQNKADIKVIPKLI
jgi:hypothetical protein